MFIAGIIVVVSGELFHDSIYIRKYALLFSGPGRVRLNCFKITEETTVSCRLIFI